MFINFRISVSYFVFGSRKLDWPGSDKLNDEQYEQALMRRYKLKGEGPEVEDEPFPNLD